MERRQNGHGAQKEGGFVRQTATMHALQKACPQSVSTLCRNTESDRAVSHPPPARWRHKMRQSGRIIALHRVKPCSGRLLVGAPQV